MLGIFHNNVVMYAYSGTKIILMYIINIINILQPALNNHTNFSWSTVLRILKKYNLRYTPNTPQYTEI